MSRRIRARAASSPAPPRRASARRRWSRTWTSSPSCGAGCGSAACRPPQIGLIHDDLPLALRALRDLVTPEVERVRIDSRAMVEQGHPLRRQVHPGDQGPHRALPGRAPAVRPLRGRGGDQEGPAAQGEPQVRRSSGDRPDRGHDHHRCQHRRLRRASQPGRDHLQDQPGGGPGDLPATAPAQPGRHHHHRFHRHDRGGAQAPGPARAGEVLWRAITPRPTSPRSPRSGWWR